MKAKTDAHFCAKTIGEVVAGIALLLSVPSFAHAADTTVRMLNELADANSPGCSAGVCIDGEGLDATRYTGWIWVEGAAKATLGITFIDANDSVTAINVQCWTDIVATTANGSGYEVCSTNTASGTTTYTCPNVRTITTGTSEQFAMTIDNLNARYLNCSFAGTGTPAAADEITVKVMRRSP